MSDRLSADREQEIREWAEEPDAVTDEGDLRAAARDVQTAREGEA